VAEQGTFHTQLVSKYGLLVIAAAPEAVFDVGVHLGELVSQAPLGLLHLVRPTLPLGLPKVMDEHLERSLVCLQLALPVHGLHLATLSEEAAFPLMLDQSLTPFPPRAAGGIHWA
jgi:hypothetical protein